MSERTRVKIRMELLSDTILGSGYSIPGAEDIAVCRDENGYPYMKGSSFKGVLRESMKNLAFWKGLDENGINEMLGTEGWNGAAEERRIYVTSLKLLDPPEDPENCYAMRTFTSLENGVIKKGTLRTAACIGRGNVFGGELICAEGDAAFIIQALMGIKWVGTLRNRGFGHVKITGEAELEKQEKPEVDAAFCLHYHLKTELPVVITDLGRSKGNHYETAGYIPGSAIRGAIAGRLAAKDPKWFEAHKKELLREIYFLDAVPNHEKKAVLPSLKGFYEKKDGSDFQTVLKDGELSPGVKRAGMGNFCAIEKNRIVYWSARTAGIMRIKKDDRTDEGMFQSHYLCEGQEFDGYILLKTPELAKKIAQALGTELWIGADRFEGFGKCQVSVEPCDEPKWRETYGYSKEDRVGKTLYLLAVSPFTMLDGKGRPCGLAERELAKLLGVEFVKVAFCSTSVGEYHTYNRTLGCALPSIRMYDRGSVFKLECSAEPDIEKLLKLQEEGLGIRKEEGCGQILFLRADLYENIDGKTAWEEAEKEKTIVSVRRAKYRWIMENDECFRGGLSNSQIGEIQGLVEKAIREGGDVSELKAHIKKNREDRGPHHGERFAAIEQFVDTVLETPVGELIGVADFSLSEQRDRIEKLELLCMLFDYSRKGKEE